MERLYQMSPTEVARGILLGSDGVLAPAQLGDATPREALEHVVKIALQRPPCGVAFSGGRDSSLVLAVATHVARRDGLPLPIPVTRRFPDVADTDESQWQERIVRHIGLDDWERVPIGDELDLVGSIAQQRLVEHGVIWPTTIGADVPIADPVRGGSMMDGEGGDEVLGVEAHRIARLNQLIRYPRPLRWRRVRSGLTVLAPATLRRGQLRRQRAGQVPYWLRPTAREEFTAALVDDAVARPLSYASSVRQMPRRRTQVVLANHRRFFGRSLDVEFSSPLLHPEVVHALARDGGFAARGDRAAQLHAMAGDLLPAEVITRTSKAVFTKAYMGSLTREFAERWNGEGVDLDIVDPEGLRAAWLADRPVGMTSALLQQAWLATEGQNAATRRG